MTGYYLVTLAHRDELGNGYHYPYAVRTTSSERAAQNARLQATNANRETLYVVSCEWVEG